MSSEKTHPVAGTIFAILLACLLVYLFGMFNGLGNALWAAPFLIGWAIISAAIFGKLDGGHDHH